MRFNLLLIAGMCLYQTAAADTILDKHMTRPAQIEIIRFLMQQALIKKTTIGNITLDEQDIAAIIEQYQNNPPDTYCESFINSVKAVLRERMAQLSNEQINMLAQGLYLRAIEISKGKQLSEKEIKELLAIDRYQQTTRNVLKISGYVWDLAIQETTRVAFDYAWSMISHSHKK